MKRPALAGGATLGAAALLLGIGIVWPGLDATETAARDTSTWVLQSDGLRYGRVNTVVGELDTVRSVANPSRLLDAGAGAYLFADSDSVRVAIDEAAPRDLDAAALSTATRAPSGTVEVDAAGQIVAYRTEAGQVWAGELDEASLSEVDLEGPADAICVTPDGLLLAYSGAAATVTAVDVARGHVRARDPVATALESPTLTAAGENWVLVEGTGRILARGQDEPVAADTIGAVAPQRCGPAGEELYLADEAGLVRVDAGDGTAQRVFGDRLVSRGLPARPVIRAGEVAAAWVPEGAGPGVAYTASGGEVALDYGGSSLTAQRRPVLSGSAEALVLNDARSGWVWQLPSGQLVDSSQRWENTASDDTVAPVGDDALPPLLAPRPPVAVDDAFGVRPGALVSLPVLLNDHDPNDDVLAIDPGSVTALDPAFGELTLTDDRQRLAVRVRPDATGAAAFSYAVTDGTSAGGLRSPPATVTLTVVGEAQQTPPQWCPVDACRQSWPTPQVARGGTISVPVLAGWVDPQGDPLFLMSAAASGTGAVAVTEAGEVVYRHDPADDAGQSTITVTVADTRGGQATRSLVIAVAEAPRPVLRSFAVVGTAGSRVSVDVAEHLTGATGEVTLSAARVLDDAEATATPVDGTTGFDFAAAAPGDYRVAVTVTSAGQDATGTVRVTLVDPDGPAQLATVPVVAFVRPQSDATVEVFSAVSNPTSRVLLLSELAVRSAPGAQLVADAVGQSQLRVSGTTVSGAAGLLGEVSYRVSDGTDDEGAAVSGTATVYLLPAASETAPIARDDHVTVRAGEQVDITVLDNDVAASGARPRLDPESVTSDAPGALAFAAGDTLRYLAPTTAGSYTVGYRAFTVGAPALGDDARVHVRVVSDEANRAPTPTPLQGRVLSGLSTAVPVTGFGMDPDGDVVRLVEIVTQPDRGSATVSADGTAIEYTSVPGDAGQVRFSYRVADAAGATGEGQVRIGILDAAADPSPITYTDDVHVQVGGSVRVHPLAGDIDPTGGVLSLGEVRPDRVEFDEDGATTAEFAQARDRIVSVDENTVTLAAGPTPDVLSYRYEARSSSGNTARGLLVVRTVAQRVDDHPIVTDTVLTVADRDRLSTGVDVLDGKVLWTGGDPAQLIVALWGAPEGLSVAGHTIRGTLDDRAHIIAFSVSGTSGTRTVTTYGFLRVPASADIAPALRADLPPLTVAEGEQITVDVADRVVLPRGSVLQLGERVRAGGTRAEARCVVVGGTTVRYTAGNGAPWEDTCVVPVRVSGSVAENVLALPVTITPVDPRPVLRGAAVEIEPGQSTRLDLTELTGWRGTPEPITYRLGAGGSGAVDAALTDTVLELRARDDAVPGTVEVAVVEVASHPDVQPARVSVRIGAPPSTYPAGGSAAQECSQAQGASCTVEVIGAAGQINPFPATPLVVTGVHAECPGVSFAVSSATAVTASWGPDTPGGQCVATFTVRDAQGRESAGGRDGRIDFALQGYPAAPAGLSQVAYADGSLTLRVDRGAAAGAFPALTGFEIADGDTVVAECDAAGQCPPIAASNGDRREYRAVAVNAVGVSRAGAQTTAWAYRPPAAPRQVSAVPVPGGPDGGRARLRITGLDPETGQVQVSSPVGESVTVSVPDDGPLVIDAFAVGANSATAVTVTPVSRFETPPGTGSAAPESVTVLAHGIGAPVGPTLELQAVSLGDGTVAVTAVGRAQPGGDGAGVQQGIVPAGTACVPGDTGPETVARFGPLPDGELYTFELCARSVLDGQEFAQRSITAQVRAVQSGAAPRGYTFVVGPEAHVRGNRAVWTIDAAPTSSEAPPRANALAVAGMPSAVFDADPGIRVRYEHTAGWWQSAWGQVTPAPGSAPTQVQARWWVDSCRGGAPLRVDGASSGDRARIRFDVSAARYEDAAGETLVADEPGVVPAEAARVHGIGVRVDWAAQAWSLDDAVAEISATCTPRPSVAPASPEESETAP